MAGGLGFVISSKFGVRSSLMSNWAIWAVWVVGKLGSFGFVLSRITKCPFGFKCLLILYLGWTLKPLSQEPQTGSWKTV